MIDLFDIAGQSNTQGGSKRGFRSNIIYPVFQINYADKLRAEYLQFCIELYRKIVET